jgi:predicted NBD/HSP70 family sugar kinase
MSANRFVLGIDLGGTKMALATAHLDGTILRTVRLSTNAERGAEQAMQEAIEAGKRIVDETASETGGVLSGGGLATMGITREDRVLMAPNVPGWERLAIPALLRAAFPGTPFGIENDVKAAARAELRWGTLQGCRTGLYVNLGTGVAATLIVDGHVVAGAHGAAGEIGYNLRTLHEDRGARLGNAPLEEFVGGGFIGERASRRFGYPLTARDVFERAADDVAAAGFVEEVLSELLFHLTNLAIAVDAERIAVGGGLMGSGKLILARLQAHVKRFVPFPPEVVAASVVDDVGLLGAIGVAIESVARPSAHGTSRQSGYATARAKSAART